MIYPRHIMFYISVSMATSSSIYVLFMEAFFSILFLGPFLGHFCQKFSLKVMLNFCLTFCQFQPDVADKIVAYK